MTQLNSLPVEDTKLRDRAFRIAAILLGSTVLTIPLLLFLAWRSGAWQIYTMTGMLVVMSILDFPFLHMIRRGRHETGIWLLLASIVSAFTVGAFLFAGLGVTSGLTCFILTLVIASQALPARSARKALALGGGAGLLLALLDAVNLDYRLSMPALEVYAPVITVGIVLMTGFIVARQTWNTSLRNKLMVAFVTISVIATGVLGVFVYTTTSNNLRDNLERELTSFAEDRAARVGILFDDQITALTALSLNDVLQQSARAQNRSYDGDSSVRQSFLDAKDSQWRAADAADNNGDLLVHEYLSNKAAIEVLKYQQAFPKNIEVFVTDAYGALLGASNRTSDYYQADEAWWQAAYNNGNGAVYISDPEYDESAGDFGVQIALPLRDQNTGEVIGVLRTTYIISALASVLEQNIGQTAGTDIFIPGDANFHIHEGGYEATEEGLFQRLQAGFGQGMIEMEYENNFSVVTQSLVQSLEGNASVDNLGWIVVFHQQREEAFASANAQGRGIIFVLLVVVAFAAAAAFAFSQILIRPIAQLTLTAQEISAGNLDSRATIVSADEVGTLATAFNSMSSQLQDIFQGLEQRVADRTRNLEFAAEVGRSVSQVRALDIMLKEATELIRARFDLYYVQVYLTNASQTALVLKAGTGAVGEQLLARSHQLPYSTSSINGRAAVEKQSVVISKTATSASFHPNPLLPDTQSEMAVPLIVSEKVVGVLDVQSSVAGSLSRENLVAFEALAGQLAVAIQNANLLAETVQARAEVENQVRRLARANWQDYLDAIHRPEHAGFVFNGSEVKPLADVEEFQPVSEGNEVSVPIEVTGAQIGSLVVEGQTSDKLELVNTVARQVAQQIEALRLLESAERYRLEAEAVTRLTTLEGWKKYIESRPEDILGYTYDANEVKALDHEPENLALTLPIKVGDETVGKFSVQDVDVQDEQSLNIAKAVVERLGAHIENLRLLEETRRGQGELNKRAQDLAAVSEISSTSAKELDIQKLLETVVHLTQRKFGLYHAHVFTFNAGTSELQIAACGWKEGNEHEGTHGTTTISLNQEQSLVARAARTQKPVIVNAVHNEPGWLPNSFLPDTKSEMAVPLIVGDQLLGVLDVQADKLNAFSQEDASIYTTLASQIATAMQNAHSFEQAQRQAARESMLNSIGQKIQSATSVEAVLQIAARELGRALGAPLTIAQLGMSTKESAKNGANGH